MIDVKLRKYNVSLFLLLDLCPFETFCRLMWGSEYVARFNYREGPLPTGIVPSVRDTRLISDKTLYSLGGLLISLLLIVHNRTQSSNERGLIYYLQHMLKRSGCLGKQSGLYSIQIFLID
jgi:hypothetical protein